MASQSGSPQQSPTGQLPHLTTRFSQPADCTALFRTANPTPAAARGDYYTVTSDESNPRFSSCQPSGWDQAQFTFSPGLCASSWTYFSLSATVSGTATVSKALCCAPSFSPRDAIEGRPIQCARSNGTMSDGIGAELRHNAWFVEWQPSDKLPLSLPDLGASRTIGRWEPGTTAPPDGGVPQEQDHGNNGLLIQMILAVVLPVFFVSLLTTAGIIACRRRRREKRRNLLAQQEQQREQQLE